MTTLTEYVGAPTKDAAFVVECETRATALIDQRLSGRVLPDAVKALAVLEVGADLYYRRSARNGIAAFDSSETVNPVRIARDPMRAVDDILRPYLGPALA